MDALCRGPRRARLGGVEHRVPAARQRRRRARDARRRGGRDRPPGRAATACDLSRVVTIGHSAGGHLAAWAATRENPRVPSPASSRRRACSTCSARRELQLSNGVVRRASSAAPADERTRLARSSGCRSACPRCSPTAARRHRAARDQRALRAGASGATLVVEPDEDHFGHLDPDEPAVAGGDRVALTRDDAPARSTPADPLAASASAS